MLLGLRLKLAYWRDWVCSEEFLNEFFNNRFCLILMVIILVHLKRMSCRSIFMAALVNLPGTILHEFMHFVVGVVLNARPVGFTVIPKRRDDFYVYGSVSFRNVTFYNAVPISLAPLGLLPIGFYINRYVLPEIEPTLFNCILYMLLQTVIIENAMPSRTDFRVAGKYKSGVILYIVMALIVVFIL